jgi:uncharacterized protein YktB (UPF0637 family)
MTISFSVELGSTIQFGGKRHTRGDIPISIRPDCQTGIKSASQHRGVREHPHFQVERGDWLN